MCSITPMNLKVFFSAHLVFFQINVDHSPPIANRLVSLPGFEFISNYLSADIGNYRIS